VTCLPMTAPPNGGNCTIRGATRRRHAEGRLLMLQNPPLPLVSWSLTGAGLPGGRQSTPVGHHRRDPAARARVGRERVRRAPINTGRASPAMTRGRRAASSAAKLVTDEALHPIGKIQPQPIRRNPPDHVQSSRCDGSHRRRERASTMTDDASARHCQPPSAARERQPDAALDNARDRAATNTFCPITLMRQGRRD